MIIVKLRGGLGNQLFQYSFGRALAVKHDVACKLDASWFGSVPGRPYMLDHFAIEATIATADEVAKLKPRIGVGRLFKSTQGPTLFTERSFQFDPNGLEVGQSAYLDGYWQSEKYFASIADRVRKELTVINVPNENNQALLHSITKTESVSLHVRRGDYVTNRQAHNYHGTMPLAYYYEAAEYIASKVPKPHFYIFSDDPDWTEANLKLDYPMTFVTGNEQAAHEDLRLMSSCVHFITANSTFSWWGAWLSSRPHKIVVAPKKWFKTAENDDADLIPTDWIRL